jgi:hypothetical protein
LARPLVARPSLALAASASLNNKEELELNKTRAALLSFSKAAFLFKTICATNIFQTTPWLGAIESQPA